VHSFETSILHFHSNLWGHHFLVPEAVSESLLLSGHRRVICTLNESLRISCALMPDKGRYFILINQSNLRKLRLKEGDKVAVVLESDNSPYGMEMPEELETMLSQDEEFARMFHRLTPGKQRNLIHIVGKVKNTDSRIRKSLAIAEHLHDTGGVIDFKKLAETLKKYNQMR
jgi:predicted DNA-binding antitoxin AbrB/MazE fold protein